MDKLFLILLSSIVLAVTTFVPAHPARAADQEQSKLDLDLRYRYEFVDQDGFEITECLSCQRVEAVLQIGLHVVDRDDHADAGLIVGHFGTL